jgi:hypothetical protein
MIKDEKRRWWKGKKMKSGRMVKFGKGLIFAVLFVAFVTVGCASATTIYVPDNYTKIQLAIDNAKAGDWIPAIRLFL